MMAIHESERPERRFFAVTSLGKDRWYWVVWPSLEELQASQEPLLHVAQGYERTKAKAVECALELAGRRGEWIKAKYAKAYHRSRTDTRRRSDDHQVAASPATPVAYEFVYRDSREPATGDWRSVPHRVVRKTRKHIYVEQHPYAADGVTAGWLDREVPTFRLDREGLEREGYAFIPATAHLIGTEEPMFFAAPHHERTVAGDRQLPKCLRVLGTSWPCTVTVVKKAYRRLVKSAHPDGGGSPDRFLALQEAYEQALRLCR